MSVCTVCGNPEGHGIAVSLAGVTGGVVFDEGHADRNNASKGTAAAAAFKPRIFRA